MQDIQAIIKEIQQVYLSSALPLYVAFSGGKDSTTVLDLIVKAIQNLPAEKRDKTIYVLFSDTLLEMPPVIEQIQQSIKNFELYCKEKRLPFIIKQVSPDVKNTFWAKLIGAGYTLPRRDFRWCTDRLKITPMNNFLKSMQKEYQGYIAVTGARKDESLDRKERLEKNSLFDSGYKHLKSHPEPNCFLFAPIEDFSEKEVWDYIYTKSEAWVDKSGLDNIYRYASNDGDECVSFLETGSEQKPGCSNSARFGCMFCPLFEKDKTLNNLSKHYSYLSLIENFRNWLGEPHSPNLSDIDEASLT